MLHPSEPNNISGFRRKYLGKKTSVVDNGTSGYIFLQMLL